MFRNQKSFPTQLTAIVLGQSQPSNWSGRHDWAARNHVSHTEGGNAKGGLVLIGPENPKFSGQRGCKKNH